MADFFGAMGSALYSTLQAGTALTALLAGTTSIYNTLAPDDATLDYVVFSHQGGGPDNDSPHRTQNDLWFVRGYSQTGPAAAAAIDAQIDALLHQRAMTVTGWTNFWLAREADFARVDVDAANNKTWMAGAFYRIRLAT